MSAQRPNNAVRVLVTGGTGFLGSAVVDAMIEQYPQWELGILDIIPPQTPKDGVSFQRCDITDRHQVYEAIQSLKPLVIVHTAGTVPQNTVRYSRKDEALIRKVNIDGTRNIIEAAQQHGVKALVYTSSCTAVTDDLSKQYPNINESWPVAPRSLVYGESKVAAEAIVLAANNPPEGLVTTCIRPPPIIGPGDETFLPSIYNLIGQGVTPFCIGDGLNLWDLAYVSNIADAHVLAVANLLSVSKTAAGQIFFVSNEEPAPFRDWCRAVWKECGHYPPFEIHIPIAVASALAVMAEGAAWLTGVPGTLSRGSVIDASVTRYCSNEKARDILGYRPRVGMEEGIRRSCADFKARKGIML